MSFDLDIETKDVDGNIVVHEVVCGHTYNLSPMWHKALPFLYGTRSLEGLNCRELLPRLEAGLYLIMTDFEGFRELNPPTGWGDFEGFLEIYTRFTVMCGKYPSGTVRWSG